MGSILVAVSDPKTRDGIATDLRADGHYVNEVADGIAALAGYARGVHDLVITDVFMPGLDGISVIVELRRRCRSLPIIAISEFSEPIGGDLLETARSVGATRTFSKPLDRGALRAAVEELVGPRDAVSPSGVA